MWVSAANMVVTKGVHKLLQCVALFGEGVGKQQQGLCLLSKQDSMCHAQCICIHYNVCIDWLRE